MTGITEKNMRFLFKCGTNYTLEYTVSRYTYREYYFANNDKTTHQSYFSIDFSFIDTGTP